MPSLNEYLAAKDGSYLRALVYGLGKSKKTWWVGTAAEAGFDVLLFDADKGAKILRQLTPAAQERIHVINCGDHPTRAVAAQAVAVAFRRFFFYWNPATSRASLYPTQGSYRYDLGGDNPNLVVALDSWTALCRSLVMQYSQENKIDLADAAKPEWDGYGFVGRLASWILGQLKAGQFHSVVVAHETTYEKYKGTGRTRRLVNSRIQPVSTSNPHGQTLAKEFDDVLRLYKEGSTFYIDTDGNKDKDAGSRCLPPAVHKWDDAQFWQVCDMGGIPRPDMNNLPPPCVYPYIESAADLQLERDYIAQREQVTVATMQVATEAAPVIQPTRVRTKLTIGKR